MITINIDKAKAIAHDKRRAKRAAEFAPHDEVIRLAIPGQDAARAEAERTRIRNKYAALQTEIDACADIGALKAVVVRGSL